MSRKYNKGSNKDSEKNTTRKGRYTDRTRKPTAFENSADDPKAYINSYTNERDNDPSWYMVNSKLVQDAAKLPFGNMVGETLQLRELGTPDEYDTYTQPGIAVLHTVPTVGWSENELSAPSRAAVAITEFLRSKLTTDESFSTADVFMYINAMDSIFALYAYITRAFGLLSNVKFNNLYTPKSVCRAIYGWSEDQFNDAVQNRANLTLRFNQYVTEAQFLYMPLSITAVERHAWLFSNVFYDSRSAKAQMYAHRLKGVYIWDEISHDTGTSNMFLDMYPLSPDVNEVYRTWLDSTSLEDLIELFHKMCYAMINSSSQLRIRMAFLKAYDGAQGWRMASLADNYLITPVHSDEVLSQINNTTVTSWIEQYGYRTDISIPEGTVLPDGTSISGTFKTSHWDITQNVGGDYILATPFALVGTVQEGDPSGRAERFLTSKNLLNFHWDNPTVEDIAVATRDMTCATYRTYPLNAPAWCLEGMGSDVVVRVTYYPYPDFTDADICHQAFLNSAASDAGLQNLSVWTAFDWAPTMHVFRINSSNHAVPFQEWDNVNTIDSSSLVQLHKAILTSMYTCKEAGMYTD